MNDTTNPARRLRHGDRPTAPLRWNDRWTLLLTGPHHGMIGPLGSTWPNQSAEYERVDVCVLREDFPVAVFRRGGEGAGSWHKLELISHGTPTDPLRDGEQLYRAGTVPKLESIEQYRMQMAAIGTASFGYWKEGDTIHPDYDTVPLRDVARLYAKYEKLHAFHSGVRTMIEMLKNRKWAEDLGAHGDLAELQGLITELVGKLAAASNWISTGPHSDNCFVSDHHEGDPGNRCNCGKDALQEFLESDRPAPDAVEAALTDAIVHGTGAFQVNGDGSTEHVDLRQAADMVRPDVTAADFTPPGTVLSEEARRHYAELAAFPPKLQRDALHQDYAVPKKEGGQE